MTSFGNSILTVRAPEAGDRLRVRAIVEEVGIFRPDEVEVALEVFQDAVSAPGKDYYALGAYDDDRLIGFACYGPTPCTVATWDLYWIAVDPTAFRQGVGRQLMKACEEQIGDHGGRLVVVETASRPDYAATRAFYQALGYAPAAHIPEYYAPDDDLMVFVKYLRPSTQEMAHHG